MDITADKNILEDLMCQFMELETGKYLEASKEDAGLLGAFREDALSEDDVLNDWRVVEAVWDEAFRQNEGMPDFGLPGEDADGCQ